MEQDLLTQDPPDDLADIVVEDLTDAQVPDLKTSAGDISDAVPGLMHCHGLASRH